MYIKFYNVMMIWYICVKYEYINYYKWNHDMCMCQIIIIWSDAFTTSHDCNTVWVMITIIIYSVCSMTVVIMFTEWWYELVMMLSLHTKLWYCIVFNFYYLKTIFMKLICSYRKVSFIYNRTKGQSLILTCKIIHCQLYIIIWYS